MGDDCHYFRGRSGRWRPGQRIDPAHGAIAAAFAHGTDGAPLPGHARVADPHQGHGGRNAISRVYVAAVDSGVVRVRHRLQAARRRDLPVPRGPPLFRQSHRGDAHPAAARHADRRPAAARGRAGGGVPRVRVRVLRVPHAICVDHHEHVDRRVVRGRFGGSQHGERADHRFARQGPGPERHGQRGAGQRQRRRDLEGRIFPDPRLPGGVPVPRGCRRGRVQLGGQHRLHF
mmetsp:Transcript_82550/g.252264  ORF Transcript_82550/g.252264 Transcript_82550/m.252264 type:complete len:231 (-) Transcript_82550:184-876(-)